MGLCAIEMICLCLKVYLLLPVPFIAICYICALNAAAGSLSIKQSAETGGKGWPPTELCLNKI